MLPAFLEGGGGTADGHPGLASARPSGCRGYGSGCRPRGPSFRASPEQRGPCQAGRGEPEGGPQGPRQGLCRWGRGEGHRPDKFRGPVLGAFTGRSWGG